MTRACDIVGCAHRRLRATDSIEALLGEVALFLEELPRAWKDALPVYCRPKRVAGQEDVLHWAQRLARERMLGASGTQSDAYRVVHNFFAHAAGHAHRLRPRRDREPASSAPRRAAPPGPSG